MDRQSVEAPVIGSHLDAYRLTGLIGKGGMSTVYLAEEDGTGKKVALKVLEPRLRGDEEFRTRFIRESGYAASLRHPNVVRVLASGECDGLLYMAMEYIEGTDLHTLITVEGRLDGNRALALLAPIASALDAAHATGLIHRDVNPANILIEPSDDPDDPGEAYLTDFGLGKNRAQDSGGLTAAGAFVGSFAYTAPEQILGRQADHRADIYSLGCVLYEALTGKPPFQNGREAMVLQAHIEEPPPRVTAVRDDIAPAIDDVVARAMAKDPAERYATCTEMIAAARVALTVGRAAPPPPVPEPMHTPMHGQAPGGAEPLRLNVTEGAAAGEEIEVDDELLIGRHATGPGRLQGDGEISRRHARVGRAGDGFVIEDLGSTNGTFVNGARIAEPRALAPGDKISLGGTTMVVAGEVEASTSTPAFSVPALSEETVALGRASVRLDIDFDARTARLVTGEGDEAVELVFEDGRWRPS